MIDTQIIVISLNVFCVFVRLHPRSRPRWLRIYLTIWLTFSHMSCDFMNQVAKAQSVRVMYSNDSAKVRFIYFNIFTDSYFWLHFGFFFFAESTRMADRTGSCFLSFRDVFVCEFELNADCWQFESVMWPHWKFMLILMLLETTSKKRHYTIKCIPKVSFPGRIFDT